MELWHRHHAYTLPDGRRAVSGAGDLFATSGDDTLKVWDLETGQEFGTLRGHARQLTAVVALEDGHRVVSAAWDETLKVWELERAQHFATFQPHSHMITVQVLTPDGQHAISGSADKTLKVSYTCLWYDARVLAMMATGHLSQRGVR